MNQLVIDLVIALLTFVGGVLIVNYPTREERRKK